MAQQASRDKHFVLLFLSVITSDFVPVPNTAQGKQRYSPPAGPHNLFGENNLHTFLFRPELSSKFIRS